MYMDNIKLLVKNLKKELETLIHTDTGYCDGIWQGKRCHENKEKRETTNDGRNITTKSRKKWEGFEERKLTSTWEY